MNLVLLWNETREIFFSDKVMSNRKGKVESYGHAMVEVVIVLILLSRYWVNIWLVV